MKYLEYQTGLKVGPKKQLAYLRVGSSYQSYNVISRTIIAAGDLVGSLADAWDREKN